MGRVLSKDLLEAAQSGDQQALKGIIEVTQTRLLRFCIVLCGDPVRAEDLCQETYLKVFSNLRHIQKPESFWSWLFQICRNLYIDEVRKTREIPTSPDESRAHPQVESHESLFQVHEMLSQFEPNDRVLLLLVDLEEYSYREAAEVLSLTEDAVRSRLFKLRQEFLKKWRGRETK